MPTRTTTKLATRKAELAANAILAGPRKDRSEAAARHTRFLVVLYPGIRRFPPLRRRRVLEDARSYAYKNNWLHRIAIAFVGCGVITLAWLHGSGHVLWACLALTVAAQIIQQQVAMRRYIRRIDPVTLEIDSDP